MADTVAAALSAGDAPASDNEKDPPPVSDSGQPKGALRVDAPEVGDKPRQAIPENEPGCIPTAFPKLFPFGTGDIHCARDGLRGRGDFGAWGRYVVLWHDGRFMRHTQGSGIGFWTLGCA